MPSPIRSQKWNRQDAKDARKDKKEQGQKSGHTGELTLPRSPAESLPFSFCLLLVFPGGPGVLAVQLLPSDY
jgi:hypothetical protein